MRKITRETRLEAYQDVLEAIGPRHHDILREMRGYVKSGVTAGELAYLMWKKEYFKIPERNKVHPRLTEMVDLGLLEVTGKRKCRISGKTCAVYNIKGL